MQVGDPVILTNAKGLGKYGLRKNHKGHCNSRVNVDDKDIMAFMPDHEMKIYYVSEDRFVVDEERLAKENPLNDLELEGEDGEHDTAD